MAVLPVGSGRPARRARQGCRPRRLGRSRGRGQSHRPGRVFRAHGPRQLLRLGGLSRALRAHG